MEKITNPTQEDWFDFWAKELQEEGYIETVYKQDRCPTFELAPSFEVSETYEKTLYKGTKRERTETRTDVKEIFSSVTYRPDRAVIWTDKARDIFFTLTDVWDWYNPGKNAFFSAQYINNIDKMITLLDVKAPAVFKGNSSDVSFSIKSRILLYTRKIHINKCMLMPGKLFKRDSALDNYLFSATFTPERFLWTNALTKERTIPNYKGTPYWVPRSLEDYVNKKEKPLHQ